MKKLRLFSRVILCLIALWGPGMVWGYIPPGTFILHSIAKKHTGFSTVRIRSNLSATDEKGNPSGPKLQETTVYFVKDHRLKSWVSDESGRVLYYTERMAGGDGKLLVIPEILFDTNAVRMGNALKAAGIPLPEPTPKRPDSAGSSDSSSSDDGAKMSLHRWNHSVAWVMGKGAELWIEKDTFVPLRIIAPAPKDSELFDFQMENIKYFDEFPYPRVATLFEAGKKQPILKAELTEAVLDMPMGASDFPKEKTEGFTDAGSLASSQIRDLIQTYYRLIR